MRVEAFHDAVPPRLLKRNEPRLDPQGQAEADEGAHAVRVPVAAAEDQLVVDLDRFREPQAVPARPEGIDGRLARPRGDRLDRAADGGPVHRVQTPEPHRAGQVAGPDVVELVDLVDPDRGQRGVRRPLGV